MIDPIKRTAAWGVGFTRAVFNRKTLNFLVITLISFVLLLTSAFWASIRVNSKMQHILFESRFKKVELDMRMSDSGLDGLVVADFGFLERLCRTTMQRVPDCQAKYAGSKFSGSSDCRNLDFCQEFEKLPMTDFPGLGDSMYDVLLEVETYYIASATSLAFEIKSYFWERHVLGLDDSGVEKEEFVPYLKNEMNRTGILKKVDKNYFSTKLDSFLDRSKYYSAKITLNTHFQNIPSAVSVKLKGIQQDINIKSVKLSISDRSLWFLSFVAPYRHLIGVCFVCWAMFCAGFLGFFIWLIYFFYYLADVCESIELETK